LKEKPTLDNSKSREEKLDKIAPKDFSDHKSSSLSDRDEEEIVHQNSFRSEITFREV